MKTKRFAYLMTGLAGLAVFTSALYAEDPAPTLSVGEQKVLDDIAAQFSGFLGDNAATLVDALRTGDSISYVIEVEQTVLDADGNPVLIEITNPDGTVTQVEQTELVEQTVIVENTSAPMGIGNIKLALGLAEASLPEDASYQDIVTALYDSETGNGILDMRANGMGWGDIYHSYDLKVGDVMRNEKAKVVTAERVQKVEKAEKPEKPERIEKPEKPERPDKPEKPEKAHGH
ncbi:hypothetical protein [Tichowtungia aerotolerans]|uniref:PepSY domain-containing protein n=1 Tax=Tichowtungia aerotolerans TaxID=2697043 RepID=A0A6P1MD53_9BACT|nr:hypothetical protein [Tichowtungia aerotolerans]QHI69025.1 hypothetical protein GT409_06060 [Tichowtungia aerotolerans]